MKFHVDKITFHSDTSFLHLDQDLVLTAFFQNLSSAFEHALHTSDIRKLLAFDFSHTQTFCKSPCLFLSYGDHKGGLADYPQRFSHWFVEGVHLVYNITKYLWLNVSRAIPHKH